MVSGRSALAMTALGATATVLSLLSAQWLLAVVGAATTAMGFYWWQRSTGRPSR